MSLLLSLIVTIAVAQNPIELNHKVYVAGIPIAKTVFCDRGNLTYLGVVPKRIPIRWLPQGTYWQTEYALDSIRYIVDNEIIKTDSNEPSKIERLIQEAVETRKIKEDLTPFTLHKVINYLISANDTNKYIVNVVLDKNGNGEKKAKKVAISIGKPVKADSSVFNNLNNILKDEKMLVPVTFEPVEGEFIERRFFVEKATIYYNKIGPVAADVKTKLFDAKVELYK